MNLAKIDLNLLVTFHALYESQQVTLAAKTVGLTQPAVSNALARLRALFNDPLFVRVSNIMQPTPRARDLAGPIGAVLSQIGDTLNPVAFVPKLSHRTIRIGTIDSLEVTIVPKLVARFRSIAPRVKLVSRRAVGIFDLPRAELDAGTLDFALGPFPFPPLPASGINAKLLFKDPLVCIMKKGRGVRPRMTVKRYLQSRHVVVFYPGEGIGLVGRILAQQSMTRVIALIVPHFFSAAVAVANSDCIATVPRSIADRLSIPLELSIVDCPISVPPFGIALFWHTRNDHDAASRWAREQIIAAAPSLVSSTGL